MDLNKFSKIAESLRQYRRAELKDFETEIGAKPVDLLYVDPLPGDAVLQSILASNTTYLLGRKGTGKSTVFAKAQSAIRTQKKIISVYLDVKAVYELISLNELPEESIEGIKISLTAFKSHILRKSMLGKIVAELLKEINDACERLSLIERWKGAKKQYDELRNNLEAIQLRLKTTKLEPQEIPILQKISTQLRKKRQQETSVTAAVKGKVKGKASLKSIEAEAEAESSLSDFDKTLDDNDIYNEYSDIVFKSFPFDEILNEIKSLLEESGLNRLVIFFDDFSELKIVDQRLFVDVVLSPLNNSSNESIKLKIAGYPGRVYYGKIDPGKTDTISLDFSDLYEATEVQEMERSATDYTSRLLKLRFKVFGANIEDYFDISSTSIDDYFRQIFQASFNVPRIMGHLLHICYLDKISKKQKITSASIRLSAKKYYENTISKYFDRLNRYALEPFENKLDRYNQQQLLKCLISEARTVRKKIIDGELGGTYFAGLSNPPTSHFIVNTTIDQILASLESNFFLSKYKNTRDKAGQAVSVYSLFLGLTESERMSWGYPPGRQYRNYFVQRGFDFTRAIHEYLSSNQTIKCSQCGQCFPLEQKASIELYKWRCPECLEEACSVVNLSDDFAEEVANLNRDIMLESVELEILTVLKEEDKKMRAGEISSLIDTTHQMVGRRTSKLQDMGLVKKHRDDTDGHMKSELTDRAERTYFE